MKGIQLDNTTYDIKVPFTVGTTTEQNQYLILTAHAGEFKEYPTLGVGLSDYTNDNDTAAMKHSIRENFMSDGMEVTGIKYSDGQLNIQADYVQD